MKQGDSVKLTAAVLIFVAAIALIAWYLGVFGGGAATLRPEDRIDKPHPGGGPQVAPGASGPGAPK